MDVQAIIAQLTEALGNAPEKVQDLLSDPKGTIEELAGQTLGDADISQIVDGVKSGIADGSLELPGIDLGGVAEGLGGLLGDNPLGSIAEGLGGLFGKK